MSQPKRYTHRVIIETNKLSPLCPCSDGEWVAHSDYAALQAENERLRKAGNAMYNSAVQDSMGLWVMPAFEQWSKIKNETK